jgi:DNA-binding NtrC family response regulator
MFTKKHGKAIRLSADAIEAMKQYSWPGNVRELKNTLERVITFNDTGVIQADELEFGEDDPSSVPPTAPSGGAAATGSLDQMEKDHIIKVLKETGGNKKKAAEILGIERRTLYNKAKRLGIDFGSI